MRSARPGMSEGIICLGWAFGARSATGVLTAGKNSGRRVHDSRAAHRAGRLPDESAGARARGSAERSTAWCSSTGSPTRPTAGARCSGAMSRLGQAGGRLRHARVRPGRAARPRGADPPPARPLRRGGGRPRGGALADAARWSSAGTRSAGASPCGPPRTTDLPIAGIVPVAPAGLTMARWLSIIEGEALLRWLLRTPVPMPEIVVREVVGRMYRSFAFARPRRRRPGRRVLVHPPRGDQARRRPHPRHRPPGDRRAAATPTTSGGSSCPVLLVWGDQDRMVYASRGRARAARGPRLADRDDRALRALPPGRERRSAWPSCSVPSRPSSPGPPSRLVAADGPGGEVDSRRRCCCC